MIRIRDYVINNKYLTSLNISRFTLIFIFFFILTLHYDKFLINEFINKSVTIFIIAILL